MKVDRTNNLTFQAKVNKKFENDVYNYCIKRCLPVKLQAFKKQLERIDYFGEPNTMFIHQNFQDEAGNQMQRMYITNPHINKKQAYIVLVSKRFDDFINFINKLTKQSVEYYEKVLK